LLAWPVLVSNFRREDTEAGVHNQEGSSLYARAITMVLLRPVTRPIQGHDRSGSASVGRRSTRAISNRARTESRPWILPILPSAIGTCQSWLRERCFLPAPGWVSCSRAA